MFGDGIVSFLNGVYTRREKFTKTIVWSKSLNKLQFLESITITTSGELNIKKCALL